MKQKISIVLISIFLVILSVNYVMANEDQYPDLTGEKLIVYITFHEEEGRRLLDLFKERTNIEYSYLRMPSGEMVTRVINESSAPKADIILGGPADAHQLLANRGLLKRYISPVVVDIPNRFKSPDGYWTGIYVGPIAIAINELRWQKEYADKGIKKPETFRDLLNPVFKGEIIMPDPATSGTAYTILASLIQLWGEDEAFAYFEELDKNVAQYTRSGFTPAQKTAVGKYLIGINFIHDQLLMKKSGFNLNSIVPKGAGWEIGCVSIIKNGSNPKAAEVFIDFMLGREAGQFHTNLTERISTRKDVMMPKGVRSLSEMPINRDYDLFKAAEMKVKYQELWKKGLAR